MPAEKPALCNGCPGKGDSRVDLDVQGFCLYFHIDSFRQARRYRAFSPEDYTSREELAKMSSQSLQYYDPETDDFYSQRGNEASTWLGIPCAERFLAGDCDKTAQEFTLESEID